MTIIKTDQACPKCGAVILWDPNWRGEGNYVCRNTMTGLCKWEMPDGLIDGFRLPTPDEAILYMNCYVSVCQSEGHSPDPVTIEGLNQVIDLTLADYDRPKKVVAEVSVPTDLIPDKVHVQAIQQLRRSNASRPIPSKKPLKRGDRSTRKRKAIEEQ